MSEFLLYRPPGSWRELTFTVGSRAPEDAVAEALEDLAELVTPVTLAVAFVALDADGAEDWATALTPAGWRLSAEPEPLGSSELDDFEIRALAPLDGPRVAATLREIGARWPDRDWVQITLEEAFLRWPGAPTDAHTVATARGPQPLVPAAGVAPKALRTSTPTADAPPPLRLTFDHRGAEIDLTLHVLCSAWDAGGVAGPALRDALARLAARPGWRLAGGPLHAPELDLASGDVRWRLDADLALAGNPHALEDLACWLSDLLRVDTGQWGAPWYAPSELAAAVDAAWADGLPFEHASGWVRYLVGGPGEGARPELRGRAGAVRTVEHTADPAGQARGLTLDEAGWMRVVPGAPWAWRLRLTRRDGGICRLELDDRVGLFCRAETPFDLVARRLTGWLEVLVRALPMTRLALHGADGPAPPEGDVDVAVEALARVASGLAKARRRSDEALPPAEAELATWVHDALLRVGSPRSGLALSEALAEAHYASALRPGTTSLQAGRRRSGEASASVTPPQTSTKLTHNNRSEP